MKSLSVYKGVFTQKQYLKLIGANVVNRFGDSIDAIVFSWMAYQITGSATWMAIVFAFNSLPSIVLMPFAGAWVETMNKKKVMVITDLCRGLLVVVIVWMYINQLLNPYILIGVTLIISTCEAFRIPAGMSIVPLVLEKKHYESGISLNASLSQISMIIGMALAGGIISMIGVVGAMMINAATFFLSSVFISWVFFEDQITPYEKSSTLRLIKEGFLYLKIVKIIFYLCLFGVGMNFLFAPFSVLQTPYVVDVLKQEAIALSIMGVSNISGMALGSFIFPMLTQKLSRRTILGISGIGIGASFVSYTFLAPSLSVYVLFVLLAIISFVFGSMTALLQTAVSVSFTRRTPQKRCRSHCPSRRRQ